MWAQKYVFDLKDKVLIPGVPRGDELSWDSLEYIPGSVLRGICVSRYLEQTRQNPGVGQTLREAFFDSDLCFLRAYPEAQNNLDRSLPTPLSWRMEKDSQRSLVNLSIEDQPYEDTTLEKIGPRFCHLYQEQNHVKALFITPEDWFTLHIQRKESMMFRYHSLNAGQKMIGYFVSNSRPLLNAVNELFQFPEVMYIGRSSGSEYGRVELSLVGVPIESWQESDFSEPNEKFITLTCLSDVILRDVNSGAFTTNLRAAGNDPIREFKSQTLVGGYNRLVNLPLPQAYAIRAGSVFIFENSPGVRDQLEEWQEIGLGERLSEGFGRVIVDWNSEESITRDFASYQGRPMDSRVQFPLAGSSEAGKVAERMLQNIITERIQTKLTQAVNNTNIGGSISNAQLNRLISELQKALDDYDASRNLASAKNLITSYFNNLKKPAQKQYAESKIDGQNLKDWLLHKLNNPGDIWQNPLHVDPDSWPKFGDRGVDKTALEFSNTIRYIILALRREIKSRKGRKS
jgi:CRISPR-associated protein Csx10